MESLLYIQYNYFLIKCQAYFPSFNKKTGNDFKPRLIDLNSHSAHSSEETSNLSDSDKNEVKKLIRAIDEFCNFVE